MRKILLLSLMLLIAPVSGQAFDTGRELFYRNIVRAHGWKCDEVQYASEGKSGISRSLSAEIKCKDGKVYYFINRALDDNKRSMSICYKGKCKKLK